MLQRLVVHSEKSSMTHSLGNSLSRGGIYLLVTFGGIAALSWEVVWQIKSSLALGVSAKGTALTLAIMMGGMSLGALLTGMALKDRSIVRPVRLYGVLEAVIGVAGLLLAVTFGAVERLDTWAYGEMPGGASFIHIGGIVAILGVPAMCMGATLPVFGLVARQFRTSIAVLYGLNTLGAAAGALIVAFFLIPRFGVTHTSWIIASLNIAVGISTWILGPGEPLAAEPRDEAKLQLQLGPLAEELIVIVTGFATFALEVAWFRSLTAAFRSTTASFAIMIASVLIALGVAARLVPKLKKQNVPLGSLISWAGILILLATPLIERFDLAMSLNLHSVVGGMTPAISVGSSDLSPASIYLLVILRWFLPTLYVVGLPMLLLGVALPWILDSGHSPRRWGKLYALNTLFAIVGSIGAAWVLLPTIGFARTAWLCGALVVVAGVLTAPRQKRNLWGAIGVAALVVAIIFESGVGRTRTQGEIIYGASKPNKILEFFEGPEATISAIEYDNGARALVVDGFLTASQTGAGDARYVDYMSWMGHLPMLLHPAPKNALVICFGTGQTANAVRQENPESLDIVDINPRVFRLAHNFTANEGVLDDARVKPIVMDGRAYMRRTKKIYDIITLEPMPPTFAGVNALYSREFYQLAQERLGPKGVIAQWVPFHLVSAQDGASIVKTFQSVFPNAILWIDPTSTTGILIGTRDDRDDLRTNWPGFKRPGIVRDLSEQAIRKAVLLDRNELRRYGAYGEVISDDNQRLAYGEAVASATVAANLQQENFDLLNRAKQPVH
jgi:spermidine synthase